MMVPDLRSAILVAGLWAASGSAAPAPSAPPDVELLEFLGGVDGLSSGNSQDLNPRELKKTIPAKPAEPATPTPGERPTKST
jgi:hypothetical protein